MSRLNFSTNNEQKHNQTAAKHRKGFKYSFWWSALCVLLSILLVFLLIPNKAFSIAKTDGNAYAESEATEQQTVQENTSESETTMQQDSATDSTSSKDNSNENTNTSNVATKVYYDNSTNQYVEKSFDLSNPDELNQYLSLQDNAEYNYDYDFSEYKNQGKLYPRLDAPVISYNSEMDFSFYGYNQSTVFYDHIEYIQSPTSDQHSGYTCNIGSQTGKYGSFIAFTPHTDISAFQVNLDALSVQTGKTATFYLAKEAITTESPVFSKELTTVGKYTLDITLDTPLKAGTTYFMFTNANSPTSTDITTASVCYNSFKSYSANRSIVGVMPITSTSVQAKLEVSGGSLSQPITSSVTTSADRTVNFAVYNVPAGSGYKLEITAPGYNTYTKEGIDVTSSSVDVGTVEFKMSDISVSGTISNGDPSYPTYGIFAYYQDNGEFASTDPVQINVGTSGEFSFSNVVADKEGVLGIYQYDEYNDVIFNYYYGYTSAMLTSKTLANPIVLNENKSSYSLTYDATTFSCIAMIPLLDNTSGATNDFKLASGFYLGETLPIFFSTRGQFDKIKDADTEEYVSGTRTSPYYLTKDTTLKLAYPNYEWSPNPEETIIDKGLSKRVVCTATNITYTSTGESYEVEQTVVATPQIIKSSQAGEYGTVRYTAVFTKTDEKGNPYFTTQIKDYKLEKETSHTHDGIEFSPLDTTYGAYIPTEGNWYLTSDIEVSSGVTIGYGQELNLCLNGHQIIISSGGTLFNVSDYGKLNLFDCKAGSSANRHYFSVGTNLLWTPVNTETYNYYDGGCITGSNYCAIYQTGGTLNIYGGGFVGNATRARGSLSSDHARGGAICVNSTKAYTYIKGQQLTTTHSSFDSDKSVNFVGNLGYYCGGAVSLQGIHNTKSEGDISSFDFKNSLFYGNVGGTSKGSRDNGGGAVFIESGYNPSFSSTNFYNNYSYGKGGAMFARGIEHDTKTLSGLGEYHHGEVSFTDCNMMYNACCTLNGYGAASNVHGWGGGIGLSTDFGAYRQVNDIKLYGTCNITENLNFYTGFTSTETPSDNVCMERHYKTYSVGLVLPIHSRVDFDPNFNFEGSNVGVNTLTWSSTSRNNLPFVAQVTNTLSGDATLAKRALACMTEDTVLDSSGYTLAHRTKNESEWSGTEGVEQIYLVPHAHAVHGTFSSTQGGTYDTLKVACEEAVGDGFQYYMEPTEELYDPDFANNDYYKCKYQEGQATMVSHQDDCVYDGDAHPVVLSNLTEMKQQNFVKNLETTYYQVDGGHPTAISGEPVEAGTYYAVTSLQYRDDYYDEWGQRVVNFKKGELTSAQYTIKQRPVSVGLIGKERPFNGEGKITEFASSYLDQTYDSSGKAIKDSGVVSKGGVFDQVYVQYGDDSYAYLQSYQDFREGKSTFREEATPTESTSKTTARSSNPLASGQDYYGEFYLGGSAGTNYKIDNYSGYCKINQITHKPHIQDIYLSTSSGSNVRYLNSTTANWLDKGDGDLGTWIPLYYYGGTDPETGQKVDGTFPWLRFNYYDPDTKTAYEHGSEDPKGLSKIVTIGSPTEERPASGDTIQAKKQGTTYLQLVWDGRDVSGDDFPEYGEGAKPVTRDTYEVNSDENSSNDQEYITVHIYDNEAPGLYLRMTAKVGDRDVSNGETVHVGETITYTLDTTNNGTADTTKDVRIYNDVAEKSPHIYTDVLTFKQGEKHSTGPIEFQHTVTKDDLAKQKITSTGQSKTLFEAFAGTEIDVESNKVVLENPVDEKIQEIDAEAQDCTYNGHEQCGLNTYLDKSIIEGEQYPEGMYETDVKMDGDKVTDYSYTITLKQGYVWKSGASSTDKRTKTFKWTMNPRHIYGGPTSEVFTYDTKAHSLTKIHNITDSVTGAIISSQDDSTVSILDCDDTISVTADSFSDNNSRVHVGTNEVTIKKLTAARDGKDISFDYVLDTGDKAPKGNLVISPAQIGITVTGDSRTTTYNTQEQFAWGAEAASNSSLFDETKLNIYDKEAGFSKFVTGQGTEVGEYSKEYKPGSILYDGTVEEGGVKYVDVEGSITYIPGTLTIDKKPMDDPEESETGYLTIKGTDKPYNGDNQTQVNADATVTYHWKNLKSDGTFTSGDTVLVADADFTLSADTKKDVGNDYKLTANATTGQGARFVKSVSGTWAITKANAIITTNSETREYDAKAHSLTYQVSELKNGESLKVIDWVNDKGEITENSITNAGSLTLTPNKYQIVAKDGKTPINPDNYNMTIVKGTLTITPAKIDPPVDPDPTPDRWTTTDAVTVYNGLLQSAFNCDTSAKVVGNDKGAFEGYELVINKDFKAEVSDYKKTDVNYIDGAVKAYEFTITGIGNFTGTRTIKFTVNQAKLALKLNNHTTLEKIGSDPSFKVKFSNNAAAEENGVVFYTFTKGSSGEYDQPQKDKLHNNQNLSGEFNTVTTAGALSKVEGHYVDSERPGATYIGFVSSSYGVKDKEEATVSINNYQIVSVLDLYIANTDKLQINVSGQQKEDMYNGAEQSVTVKNGTTGSNPQGWSAKVVSEPTGLNFDLSKLTFTSADKVAKATNVGTPGEATIVGGTQSQASGGATYTIGDFSCQIGDLPSTVTKMDIVIVVENNAKETITQRPISVTPWSSSSDTKEQTYNGKELKFNDDEFKTDKIEEKGGLVEGQNAAVTKWNNNSITNAGTQDNVSVSKDGFTIKDGSTDVTANYYIAYNNGKLKVNPRNLPDENPSRFVVSANSYIYNALERDSNYVVKGKLVAGGDDVTLTLGTDFDFTKGVVSKTKATDAGDYTISVTGKNNYTGTISTTWKIDKRGIVVGGKDVNVTYDGNSHAVTEATHAGIEGQSESDLVSGQVLSAQFKKKDGGNDPVNVADTPAQYTPINIKITSGSADVTHNYNVSTSEATVTITQSDISDLSNYKLEASSPYYSGVAQETLTTLTRIKASGWGYQKTLVKDKDYKIVTTSAYKEKDVNTANDYIVKVEGINNFKNEISAIWNIKKIDAVVVPTSETFEYDGKEHSLSKVTFKYKNPDTGKLIAGLVNGESNKDGAYDVTWSSNNKALRDSVSGITVTKVDKIYLKDQSHGGTETPTTNYNWTSESGSITINGFDISKADLEIGKIEKVYNSQVQTYTKDELVAAGVKLYKKGTHELLFELTKDDFDITSVVKSEVHVGEYDVTIKGKNGFIGENTSEKSFKITPANLTVTPQNVEVTYDGISHSITAATYTNLQPNDKIKFDSFGWDPENKLTDAGQLSTTPNGGKFTNSIYSADFDLSKDYKVTYNAGTIKINPKDISGDEWTVANGTTTYNGTKQNAFDLHSDYVKTYANASGETVTVKAKSTSITHKNIGSLAGVTLEFGKDFEVTAGDYEATDVALKDGAETQRTLTVKGKGNYTGQRSDVNWLMKKAWAKMYGETYKLWNNDQAIVISFDNTTAEANNMYFETQAGINKLVENQVFASTLTTGVFDAQGNFTPEGKYYVDSSSVKQIGCYYQPNTWEPTEGSHKMGGIQNKYSITDSSSTDVKANYDVDYEPYINYDGVFHACTKIGVSPDNKITVQIHANSVNDEYDGTAHSVTLPADTDFDNYKLLPETHAGNYVYVPKDAKSVNDAKIWLEVTHPVIELFNIGNFSWKTEGSTAKKTNAVSVNPVASEVQSIALDGQFVYTPTSEESQLTPHVVCAPDSKSFTHTITKKTATVVPDANKGGSSTPYSYKTKVYDGTELKYSDDEIYTTGVVNNQKLTPTTWNKNSIINVGKIEDVTVSSSVIKGTDAAHSTESDLTSNYNITPENGTLEVTPKDISEGSLFKLEATSFTYDAKEHNTVLTLTGKLTEGGQTVTLVEGKDFMRNTDSQYVYTATDNSGNQDGYKVSVTGIGNFKGTKDANWEINPIDLTVTVESYEVIYDTLMHGGKSTSAGLVDNQHLSNVTYKQVSSTPQISGVEIKDVGKLTLGIDSFDIESSSGEKISKNNYNISTKDGSITVKPRSIDGDDFRMLAFGSYYTGSNQDAEIVVYYQGEEPIALTPGRDYELDTDKVNAAKDFKTDGNYVAGVKGKGNFTGSKTAEWNIIPIEAILELNGETFTYDGQEHHLSSLNTTGVVAGEKVNFEDVTISKNSLTDAGTLTVTPSAVNKMYQSDGKTATPSTNYMWTFVSGDLVIKPLDIGGNDWIVTNGKTTYNGASQNAFDLHSDYIKTVADSTGATKTEKAVSASVKYNGTSPLKDYILIENSDFIVTEGQSNAIDVELDSTGAAINRQLTIVGKGNFTGQRSDVKWLMNKAWAKMYGEAYRLWDNDKAAVIGFDNTTAGQLNMYFETQSGVNKLPENQRFTTTLTTGVYDAQGNFTPEGKYYEDGSETQVGCYYLPNTWEPGSAYHKMGGIQNNYSITDTKSAEVKANYDIDYSPYIKSGTSTRQVCTKIGVSPLDKMYVVVHANSAYDVYDGNEHSVTLPSDTDFDNFYQYVAYEGSYVYLPAGVTSIFDAPVWLEVIHPQISVFEIGNFAWIDPTGTKQTKAISVVPEAGSSEIQSIELDGKFKYTPTEEELLTPVVVCAEDSKEYTHTILPTYLEVSPDINAGTGELVSNKTQVYNGKELKFADTEYRSSGLVTPTSLPAHSITNITWLNNEGITNVGKQDHVAINSVIVKGQDAAHSTESDLTSNYYMESTEGSLEVTKKDFTDDAEFKLDASSFVYDEESHDTVLTLTGKLDGTPVTLVEGKDFTRNTGAEYTYTATDNSGTTAGYKVGVTGIGNYKGTKTTNWEIAPVNLTVSVENQPGIVYDTEYHSGTFTSSGLVKQQSLTNVTYKQISSSPQIQGVSIKNVGNLVLDIDNFDIRSSDKTKTIAKKNYIISTSQGTLTVVPRSIGTDDFEMVATGGKYTGAKQDAEIHVYYVGPEGTLSIELTQGRDYKLDSSKTNAAKDVKVSGDYTAGVTGLGNFTGDRQSDWNITPLNAYLRLENAKYTYDKKAHGLTTHNTSGLVADEYVNFADIAFDKTNSATNVSDSKKITPTGVNKMYSANATETPVTNYNWTFAGADLTIVKRNVAIVVNGKNDTVEYDAKEHSVPNESQVVGYQFDCVDPAEKDFVTEADPKLVADPQTYVITQTNVNRDASGEVIPYSKSINLTDFDYTNKDNIDLVFTAGADEWLKITPRGDHGQFSFKMNAHDKRMYDSGYNLYDEPVAHVYEIDQDQVTVVDESIGLTLPASEFIVTGEKSEVFAYSSDPAHDGRQADDGRIYTVGAMGSGVNYEKVDFTDMLGKKVSAEWEIYKRSIEDTWEDYTYYQYDKLIRYDGKPHSLGVVYVGKHSDGEPAVQTNKANDDEDPFSQLVTVDQQEEVNIVGDAYTEAGWYTSDAVAVTNSNYIGKQKLYWAIVGDDVEGFGDITWKVEVSDAKYSGTSVAQSKADVVKSTGDANKLGKLIQYTQEGMPDNSFDIRMYVDDATEHLAQDADTRGKFENAYGTADQLLYQYLDINIWNELTLMREDPDNPGKYRPVNWDEDLDVIPTHITELNEPEDTITTTLPVPSDLLDKVYGKCEAISVYRHHDGVVEKIDTIADNNNKTITFNSDKFSEFALTYDKNVAPDDDNNNGYNTTGKTSDLIGLIAVSLVASAALVFVVTRISRRRINK